MAKYTPYVDDEKEINLLPRKLTPVEAELAAKEARVMEPAPDMERIGWKDKQGYVKGQGKLQLRQEEVPNKYTEYVEESPSDATHPLGTDWENYGQGVLVGGKRLVLGAKQRMDEVANALESTFGGQGINRALGMRNAADILPETQQKVIEDRRYNAPLMNTKAGKWGGITSTAIPAIAAGFVPGAQGIAGSLLAGGVLGAAEPTLPDESVVGNTLWGAGLNAVVPGAAGLFKLGKAATIDPFIKSGQEDIARVIMQNFGIGPQHVGGLTSKPTITGARTTMAEQIGDTQASAGAARLQDSLRVNPENAARYTQREIENNKVRTDLLHALSGTDGEREAFDLARSDAAKQLYKKAYDVPVNMAAKSHAERGELAKLLKIPAIQDAMKTAQVTAKNKGLNLQNIHKQVEGLHLTKMEMDDAINNATKAEKFARAASIKTARDRLVTFIERMSPDYENARKTYAAQSKPINQFDIADEVRKRGTSSLSDLGGSPRVMPGGITRAMSDEKALIKKATGGKVPQKELKDILEPDQLQKLKAVSSEADQMAAVASAGAGPGSPTTQRAVGQNILNKFGSLAGPAAGTMAQNSTVLNTMMKLPQMLYQHVAEPRIQQILTDMTLDPGRANEIMAKLSPSNRSEVEKALKSKAVQRVFRAALPSYFLGSE